MSNFLAIATVTAALSVVLSEALATMNVGGAKVTTVRPDSNGGMSGTGVNIFLYQVTANAALRNFDLPTRGAGGELVSRPLAALNLDYLLSFYGVEADLEPQRLLGGCVRTLNSQPIITRDLIEKTIAEPGFGFLANSNLADAVESVKIAPLNLNLEELSKLWSVYFQTPYSLSVAYQATVVLIESEDSVQQALPVRARNIYVAPFRQPFVTTVKSADETNPAITLESTVVITGERLSADVLRVLISGVDATAGIQSSTDTRIQLTLPASLRAGVQGLQIMQPRMMGTPEAEHVGVQSNLAAFVLHPTIKPGAGNQPDITFTAAGANSPAAITIKLIPSVTPAQRVSLILNELNPPNTRAALAFRFEANPRDESGAQETDTVEFAINGVPAGDYLVRVEVDGATSGLETSSDETNPVFTGPKVSIT